MLRAPSPQQGLSWRTTRTHTPAGAAGWRRRRTAPAWAPVAARGSCLPWSTTACPPSPMPRDSTRAADPERPIHCAHGPGTAPSSRACLAAKIPPAALLRPIQPAHPRPALLRKKSLDQYSLPHWTEQESAPSWCLFYSPPARTCGSGAGVAPGGRMPGAAAVPWLRNGTDARHVGELIFSTSIRRLCVVIGGGGLTP